MKALIAAAGLSTRLGDLSEKRNKVLLDLGGASLLSNLLDQFERAGFIQTYVVTGFDAPRVQQVCSRRATCILNPFFEHHGILSSVWLARPDLVGVPFVFTTGDHYFTFRRLQAFLADQPHAEVLVDIELKSCDEEDMKVYVNKSGQFRTMTKTFLKNGLILGEFTSLVRFSGEGSEQFFDSLARHVAQHGIQGYLADVLCTHQRKWDLAFHLSNDHQRVDVDFPCDLTRARELYAEQPRVSRRTG
jgi:choline kinase